MKKILKKIAIFTIVLSLLLEIPEFQITAKADYCPVQMYYCDVTDTNYGFVIFKVYILVDKNCGFHKYVYINQNEQYGVYKDFSAIKIGDLDDDTELWTATFTGYKNTTKYYIKLVCDGTTYYDNNNGKSFTSDDIIGSIMIKVLKPTCQSTQSNSIRAAVKNTGSVFANNVILKYTINDWNSYNFIAMSKNDLTYSETSYNPNYNYYSTNISSYQNFKFCVGFTINGKTYWDDNFGKCYDSSYFNCN